jgi:hypothetical protein
VRVQVKLRAVVPVFSVESLAVASRLSMRASVFASMAAPWSMRPEVPVATNPRLWWRHAISAIVQECRKLRRRRISIYAALRRRKLRHRYVRLYQRCHTDNLAFHDPNRRCACCLSCVSPLVLPKAANIKVSCTPWMVP